MLWLGHVPVALQVLQGRLFCGGSLLDQATRCLLLPGPSNGSSGSSSGGGGGSSGTGSVAATSCSAAHTACTYLSPTQLAAALAAPAAATAAPYLRLAALANFNDWPPPGVGAGSRGIGVSKAWDHDGLGWGAM